MESQFEYDVCLSFAGANHELARQVADSLRANNIRVFYDEYEKVNLFGKNLYTYLNEIYRIKSKFCIMFISKEYKDQLYTQHERASIQARAFSENSEYILPYRIDDTDIPGLLQTIAFLSLATTPPAELATVVIQKIALIKNDYSTKHLADKNVRFNDLLYNFSQDIGHLRWGHFKSNSYKKNGIELMFDPTEHFRLSTENHDVTGTNLMDLPLSGKIEFSYSPRRFNQTADNLLIYIIPIISEKRAMPVELGFSKVSDPDNAGSQFRIKYVCKGKINTWLNDSISYDFSMYTDVNYVIFVPRINEGCSNPNSGELLIKDVNVYSDRSSFPDFWQPYRRI